MHEGMNERAQVGVIGELGLLGGPGAAAAAGKGALAGGGRTSLRGLHGLQRSAPLLAPVSPQTPIPGHTQRNPLAPA